jgi:hypothetical protein
MSKGNLQVAEKMLNTISNVMNFFISYNRRLQKGRGWIFFQFPVELQRVLLVLPIQKITICRIITVLLTLHIRLEMCNLISHPLGRLQTDGIWKKWSWENYLNQRNRKWKIRRINEFQNICSTSSRPRYYHGVRIKDVMGGTRSTRRINKTRIHLTQKS